MVGGPGDPNLQSVLCVCIVSGFLEAAAVVGGPGDPNLQSALTIETGPGKDVTLTAISPNRSVRALGPENQWLGGEVPLTYTKIL